MNKSWPFVLFIALFVGSFFLWKEFFSQPKVVISPSVEITTTASPKQVTEVLIPERLVIPKLKIDANSESVGMDKQGRMDIPQQVTNVAWYNLGVKPGQKGNAVFAGHFDKPDGSPSVFYEINKLAKGDLIETSDINGKKLIFEVTETRVVDLNKFPLQEVFGETNKIRVNLITCGGKWDKEKKEYSERTIVFSELKT